MVLGFELTTFGNESPPITTRPGLPPKLIFSYIRPFFVRNRIRLTVNVSNLGR